MDERVITRFQKASRIVVFTGAGVSTGAGIPDYRGPIGQYSQFQPVYFDEFLADEAKQREYWTHKASVWPAMRDARPGPAHILCRVLAETGRLTGVITQNVDGLHEKAGLDRDTIVNLHGSNLEVECVSCGRRVPAAEVLDPLSAETSGVTEESDGREARNRDAGGVHNGESGGVGGEAVGDQDSRGETAGDQDPRGEVAGGRVEDRPFAIPRCSECGGLLKPATIMFGQSLRSADLVRAEAMLGDCDLFVVMGSTLTVQPAASLPAMAQDRGAELAIITRGPTPLDDTATYRIDGDIDPFCAAVMERLER